MNLLGYIRLLVFNAELISLYVCYRLLIPAVGWEFINKSWLDHYDCNWRMCFVCSLAFCLGNYDTSATYYLFGSIPFGLLLFGFLGMIPWLQFSLEDAGSILSTDYRAMIVYLTGLLLAVLLYAYHLYLTVLANRFVRHTLLIFLSFTALGIVLLLIGYGMASSPVYLHHWILFWIGTLLTRYKTRLSQISAGICFGVITQAYAAFNGYAIYD